MRRFHLPALLSAALVAAAAPAPAAPSRDSFDIVVLGARGGIEDGNLTSFLIRPRGDDGFLACDAGTLTAGIEAADRRGAFADVKPPPGAATTRVGYILTERVKGYLISHAHLDHVAGLIVASPEDSKKPIYALASTHAKIAGSYFNHDAWANFADTGAEPRLGKYHFVDLVPGEATPATGTAMSVTALPLAHGPVESTAFLLRSKDASMLCFGDTGADRTEHAQRLHAVWSAVADDVRHHTLKAIVIEASFPNSQPETALFGHMTPKLLLEELHDLADQAGGPQALRGLPVVVSHIKYSFKAGERPQAVIRRELEAGNDLGVRFIIPEQGDRYRF
ncbi:MBL fold metallo-hydrolase [Caulobacter sp. KR2-114]|uniref:MBL fold metallo-hydrolase n=1 Tax=Caulobacter sp. KR2-114 TaxID=3400912 RepID=UPI003C10C9C0